MRCSQKISIRICCCWWMPILPVIIIKVAILIALQMSLSKPARKFRFLKCISYHKKKSNSQIPKVPPTFTPHVMLWTLKNSREYWQYIAIFQYFMSFSSPWYYRLKELRYFEGYENIARWWKILAGSIYHLCFEFFGFFCSFWRGKAGDWEQRGYSQSSFLVKGVEGEGCLWFFKYEKTSIF